MLTSKPVWNKNDLTVVYKHEKIMLFIKMCYSDSKNHLKNCYTVQSQ